MATAAVLTTKAAPYATVGSVPPVNAEVNEWRGHLRVMHFKLTLAVAHGIASTITLVKLPAGRVRVINTLSRIFWTNPTDGAAVDIGYAAHVDSDGTAVVASTDYFADAATDSAGTYQVVATGATHNQGLPFGHDAGDVSKLFDSKGGVEITLSNNTDTLQALLDSLLRG
jgi:hypothetical protein